MNDLIKDIGRSYIISSLLPAAAFILLSSLIFHNPVSATFNQYFPVGLSPKITALEKNWWLIPAIISVWLGFALYSSVDWVVKLFEGYLIPHKSVLYRFFHRRQVKEYEKKLENYQSFRVFIEYKKYLEELEAAEDEGEAGTIKEQKANKLKELGRPEWIENPPELGHLRAKAVQDLGEAELRFPLDIDKENLLPTALGNILLASELYGKVRYQMEALSAWNRLYKVMPEMAIKELEEKNNQLVFLLNSALLVFLLAFATLLVALGNFVYYFVILKLQGSMAGFPGQEGVSLFIGYFTFWSVIFFCLGYFLYRLSLHTAEDFGLIVRSCIDLYRFDLLKHLHFPIPENMEDEKNRWSVLGEFMLAGLRLSIDPVQFSETHFNYHFSKDEQQYIQKNPSEEGQRFRRDRVRRSVRRGRRSP